MIRRGLVTRLSPGNERLGSQKAINGCVVYQPGYRAPYDNPRWTGSASRKRGRQRGFSLIEVLVALVLLSVGLLGLAGLQLASLQNNVNALMRSQAMLGADSILERVRANKKHAAEYVTGFKDDAGAHQGDATADALAQADLAAWKSQLADTLPGGKGRIDVAGESCSGRIANCRVTVTIRWLDKGDNATRDQTASNAAQLQTRQQHFAVKTQL